MSVKNYVHSACDNCNNFTMYFTKSKYGYYVARGCGKCRINEYTEEELTKLPYDFVCDKWEKRKCGGLGKASGFALARTRFSPSK